MSLSTVDYFRTCAHIDLYRSFTVIKLILPVCLLLCKPKYIQNAVVLFSTHAFSMLENLRNAFNALLIYLRQPFMHAKTTFYP